MLQIGDKVQIDQTDSIREVTGINRSPLDPSVRLYALDNGLTIWYDYELTFLGVREAYPNAKYEIGDVVTVDDESYIIGGISLKDRDTQPVYRYRLRPIERLGIYEYRDEHELIENTNYTLF